MALVGGAFSFYFYSVFRGWIAPKQIWIPKFCELRSSQCLSIVESKYGQIFGLTNALLGIFVLIGYAIILIGTSLDYINQNQISKCIRFTFWLKVLGSRLGILRLGL